VQEGMHILPGTGQTFPKKSSQKLKEDCPGARRSGSIQQDQCHHLAGTSTGLMAQVELHYLEEENMQHHNNTSQRRRRGYYGEEYLRHRRTVDL
jgi:hypothetical protein